MSGLMRAKSLQRTPSCLGELPLQRAHRALARGRGALDVHDDRPGLRAAAAGSPRVGGGAAQVRIDQPADQLAAVLVADHSGGERGQQRRVAPQPAMPDLDRARPAGTGRGRRRPGAGRRSARPCARHSASDAALALLDALGRDLAAALRPGAPRGGGAAAFAGLAPWLGPVREHRLAASSASMIVHHALAAGRRRRARSRPCAARCGRRGSSR